MLMLTFKAVCLILLCMLLALEIGSFRADYSEGYPMDIFLDVAIIVWLVVNVVMLLMWL